MVGSCRLGALIGRGGTSEVFEAEHLASGATVAVKCIDGGWMSHDQAHRITDEAVALGSVRHPGVVRLFDAGQEPGGDIYLVLEWLDGPTLESALSRRCIGPLAAVRVAIHLLGALAAVHRAGWVHRDVKPSNVMLSATRTRPDDGIGAAPDRQRSGFGVRLIDFGVAARMGAAVSVSGTLEYMAPEQALGGPVDGRSDLWSLGALLYRAVVGAPPWPARFPAERARTLEEPPPDPRDPRPDCPPDLAKVLGRALAPDPCRRFGSAAQLAAALGGVDEARLARLGPPGREAATSGLSGASSSSFPRNLEPRSLHTAPCGARSGETHARPRSSLEALPIWD